MEIDKNTEADHSLAGVVIDQAVSVSGKQAQITLQVGLQRECSFKLHRSLVGIEVAPRKNREFVTVFPVSSFQVASSHIVDDIGIVVRRARLIDTLSHMRRFKKTGSCIVPQAVVMQPDSSGLVPAHYQGENCVVKAEPRACYANINAVKRERND